MADGTAFCPPRSGPLSVVPADLLTPKIRNSFEMSPQPCQIVIIASTAWADILLAVCRLYIKSDTVAFYMLCQQY